MNIFTVIIFSALLIGIVLYYIIKNICVNSISKAMKNKEYKKVIQLSERGIMKRFLSPYVCDLYKVRAYSSLSDEQKFKKVLNEVIEKNYPLEKQIEFLESYLHYFMLKHDREYAEKLLHKIHDIADPETYGFQEIAFEVMMNKRTDFIPMMDEQINSKKYSGFPLGVLVYLIGMQYLYLDNKDEARTYFYNSLACFHKNSVYTDVAKKQVEKLSNELGLPVPKY